MWSIPRAAFLILCRPAVPQRPCGAHLRPETFLCVFRSPIKHQHVAVVEQAGNSQFERLVANASIEHECRIAQRAIRDGDGRVGDDIVDDLVLIENPERGIVAFETSNSNCPNAAPSEGWRPSGLSPDVRAAVSRESCEIQYSRPPDGSRNQITATVATRMTAVNRHSRGTVTPIGV